MNLTPKQEQFCLAYLETGNASEAYRQAYNAGKMKPESIWRKAKELLDNGKVSARVKQLQEQAAKTAVLDRGWVISRLMKVVEIGLNEGKAPAQTKRRQSGPEDTGVEATQFNLSAATRALEALGKTKELRLFVTSHEHSGSGGGPIPVLQLTPDQLANMTDAELAALESAFGKLGGSSGDGQGGEGEEGS